MHKILKIEYMYQVKYATEIINNRFEINDTDENVHVMRRDKKKYTIQFRILQGFSEEHNILSTGTKIFVSTLNTGAIHVLLLEGHTFDYFSFEESCVFFNFIVFYVIIFGAWMKSRCIMGHMREARCTESTFVQRWSNR